MFGEIKASREKPPETECWGIAFKLDASSVLAGGTCCAGADMFPLWTHGKLPYAHGVGQQQLQSEAHAE